MTDALPPARTSASRTDGDDARAFALLAHRLGGCTTLPEVYEAGVVAVRDVLAAGIAAVARIEQDEWRVLTADPTDALPSAADALTDGEAVRALVHRHETWLSIPGDEPTRTRPVLVAPVIVNGDLWGVLCAVRDEHATPFRRVADDAAQSAIDSGEETCIVMCDVDGLKRVNDELGHDAGDDLLRSVAAVLRRTSSGLPGSTVARIGGDEFCIVTCGIPRTTVVQVVDATVGDNALRHGASLSYGIASSARGSLGAAPTPRSLFRRADAAQYHAKRSHAAARARQYRADDPGVVLGRTVTAGVTALSAAGPGPLTRLCALAAAVTEAMGGSGWSVLRDLPREADAPMPDGPVLVARGGTPSLNVSRMRQIELHRAPWSITLETMLPADDRTVSTTLQTLVALAVVGSG